MSNQAVVSSITPTAKAPRNFRIPSVLISSAMGFLLIAALCAVFANVLAPYGYNDQNLLYRLKPPSFLGGPQGHYLGTDELGRDVFSRLVFSLRFSLIIAIAGTLIGAGFGTLLGFLAAHFRGVCDEALSALIDFQAAIPFMIFALAALAFFGNSILLFVTLLGLYGWEVYARLVRGLVLSAKELGYVEALRNLGFHPVRIYGMHVLPNIAGSLLVQITLNLPGIIILESGLSFLGLGIQPPLTSLGLMIGNGREFMTTAWWTAVAPGLVIFLTALSVTLVGDWLRDRLDASTST
ncbi:ABC transporter permease [Mesorhizobium tianshanense]|uniref:Peptide/nickel transport system permease protein n=1 Tax=Mesorhizobium tianshanense TaxID=39844 RepID=A0A562NBN8_9HYPH|nr:ABC transporter permease [Mesorhizobium tianshanense]TWI29547.1 peptide/nickel transport system permease protein [Mesorhizobium tianshanense]